MLILIALWVLMSIGITAWHESELGSYPQHEALRPAMLVLGFFWLYSLVLAWLIHHGKIINVYRMKRRAWLFSSPEALLLLLEYTLLVGPIVFAELLFALGLPGWQTIVIKGVCGALGIAWGLNNLKAGAGHAGG